MERSYPNMSTKEHGKLKKDFAAGHSLVLPYERVVGELRKMRLVGAFEFCYQQGLHKRVADIVVEGQVIRNVFLAGESSFSARLTSRLSDGEEHSMDHSQFRNPIVRSDRKSDFAAKSPVRCQDAHIRSPMLSNLYIGYPNTRCGQPGRSCLSVRKVMVPYRIRLFDGGACRLLA